LPLNDSRGQEYVDVIMTELFCLFSCSSGLQCAEKIHEIMSLIGLETDSARLGLTSSDDIGHIVRSINLERLSNNPIAVSSDIINAAVKGNYSELSGVF
jgi:hypothetical protein